VDVSDVLRDRMSEPAGFERMALVSAAAHGAVLAAILFAPAGWLGGTPEAPRVVMTISLGSGTPGPKNGGMTSIGGRAIQEQAPPEPPKTREEVRPPAAKAPDMTVPKGTPLKNANAAVVKQAPDQARGRTPTRGAQPTPGSALVETGVRGQGFGLSTGGGTGTGSSLDIDVANFCCPEYLIQMVDQIRENWNDKSDVPGEVVVKFTIQRNGTLAGVEVEKPSGYVPNNLAAQRAVALTRQLVPLPAGFPNPTLTVHLNFKY
jgi:TonB family protein